MLIGSGFNATHGARGMDGRAGLVGICLGLPWNLGAPRFRRSTGSELRHGKHA